MERDEYKFGEMERDEYKFGEMERDEYKFGEMERDEYKFGEMERDGFRLKLNRKSRILHFSKKVRKSEGRCSHLFASGKIL